MVEQRQQWTFYNLNVIQGFKHKIENWIRIYYRLSITYNLVSSLHGILLNISTNIASGPGPMTKKPIDILHACLTNQLFILLVAILLVLLVILLEDQTSSSHIFELLL